MKHSKGFSLFIFMMIVVIVVLIVLVGKMVFHYLQDSLHDKEKLGITTFMSNYEKDLQNYIEEKSKEPDFDVSQLDYQKLEDIIKVAEWYQNKYIVLDGKIVGLADKMTEKEKDWLKDRIQIQ